MNRFTLSQMMRLPRLSEIVMPSYGEFYPEKLITDVGLYEAVLIDTTDIQVYEYEVAGVIPHIEVSYDVEVLHKFMNLKDRIMLPCPECRQQQPFELKSCYNPQKVKIEKSEATLVAGKMKNKIPVMLTADICAPVDDDGSYNIFDPPEVPKYRIGMDYLRDYDRTQFSCVDFTEYKYQCALACVDGIAEQISEMRRDFFCTLNNTHRGFVDFIIYEAIDRYNLPAILQQYEKRKEKDPDTLMTKDEEKALEAYNRLKTCLIMEKVGQSPSLADIQMFDIEKYRSVLSKEHFRDFKTALGLYASGVGCGSFLYLRRIFEGLVMEAETEASKQDEWDAEEYRNCDFNKKIEYLDSFGQKLIPDELSAVKAKIYGVLSRGVHASSDQECNELFNVMKYAIEELLDHKIAKREKEEKQKQLISTLSKIK